MNVLVIAPHPDDEAIGCGGAVCLHADRGDRITAVFLTSGEQGLKQMQPDAAQELREGEARESASVLGIAETIFLRGPDLHLFEHEDRMAARISEILVNTAAEMVYVPHAGDSHTDHQAAARILAAAVKDRDAPERRSYEVWTPMTYYDDGEDISRVIKRKVRAIRCHRSQVAQLRYDRAAHGLNQYRGAVWACRFAEVFQRLNAERRGGKEAV